MTRFITRQHAYEMDKMSYVGRQATKPYSFMTMTTYVPPNKSKSRRKSSLKLGTDVAMVKPPSSKPNMEQYADPNELDRNGITPLMHLVGVIICQRFASL